MNMLMGCFQPGLRGVPCSSQVMGVSCGSPSRGFNRNFDDFWTIFNGLVLLGKSKPETIDFGIKYGGFL